MERENDEIQKSIGKCVCLKWGKKMMKRNRNKYKVLKFSLKKESAIIKNISCQKRRFLNPFIGLLHCLLTYLLHNYLIAQGEDICKTKLISEQSFGSLEITVLLKGLRQDLQEQRQPVPFFRMFLHTYNLRGVSDQSLSIHHSTDVPEYVGDLATVGIGDLDQIFKLT